MLCRLTRIGFYSRLVRLKLVEGPVDFTDESRFYSRLVRLKLMQMGRRSVAAMFLFQIGAIKTSGTSEILVCFGTVSIPDWCD